MVTFKKIKQTVTGKLLVEGECASADSKPIDIIANGSKLFEIDTGSWYFFNEGAQEWVKSVRGGAGNITVDELTVTENGTYMPEDEQHAFGRVDVDVSVTFHAEDEGLVVHNGGLVGYTFPWSYVVQNHSLETIFQDSELYGLMTNIVQFGAEYGHVFITLKLPQTLGGLQVRLPLYYEAEHWQTSAVGYGMDENNEWVLEVGAELDLAEAISDTDEQLGYYEVGKIIMQRGTTVMNLISYLDSIQATVEVYIAGDPWPPEDEPEPDPEEP